MFGNAMTSVVSENRDVVTTPQHFFDAAAHKEIESETAPLLYQVLLGQAVCQGVFSQELPFASWLEIYNRLLQSSFFKEEIEPKKPAIYHQQYWHYYYGNEMMICDHRGQSKAQISSFLACVTQPRFQIRCYRRHTLAHNITLLGTLRHYDHQDVVHKFTFCHYANDVKITAEVLFSFPGPQLTHSQLLSSALGGAVYQIRLETSNSNLDLQPYLQLLLG